MNPYKRNYLIYFYMYFVIQMVYIYVNVYLPIYFFNILKVNRIELAFVQIFSYSAFFIRPLIAIYFDKEKYAIKRLIILSSVGIFISFIFFIFNLNLLIIFGIFLGINFACASIMRVAIEKIIIVNSPDDRTKNKNALSIQLGAVFGALFPNIIFIIIFTDLYSLPTWNQFFLIGILSLFPIVIFGFLLKITTEPINEMKTTTENRIDKRRIILLSIILFLFYAEGIYEYPAEPWILNKIGEENVSLLAMLIAITIVINALGLILASFYTDKFDRIKVLTFSSLAYGILLIIAPFTDMFIFFILFVIMQIFSGFIVVNLIALMIEFSQKRAVYFQLMTASAILAIVIFVPLGTYLSAFIATELIFVAAGVMKLISIIPILLLTERNQNESVPKNQF